MFNKTEYRPPKLRLTANKKILTLVVGLLSVNEFQEALELGFRGLVVRIRFLYSSHFVSVKGSLAF